jgi:hypothetical protein
MGKEAIPAQRKGASFDIREAFSVAERSEAIAGYNAAKRRLLDISRWGNYAREAPETFILTDALGNVVKRPAVEGDHIKIHLPGPRLTSGDGADWVVIEKIMEERNKILDEIFIAMTVRPCPNPHLTQKKVAHFYDDHSTNTFLVCRHKIELTASIHGRNELVNTETNWLDFLRNLMVALPAKAGLSNPHWRRLAKGLIGK